MKIDVTARFRWLRPALCRLFCWRNLKRAFIAGAVCLVLFALLHLVENWRGRRAWEALKRDWEAKGERFDFANFIPPPVPDDQNFALTPIVASCYGHVLDRTGHRIEPENTKVVNRLEMDIYRHGVDYGTNLDFGSWQKARFTDLKAWQDHYRAAATTSNTGDQDEILRAFARRYGINGEGKRPPVTNEFPVAAKPQSPAADVLLALSKYDSAIEELRQASGLRYSRFPLEYSASNPTTMVLPHYESLKDVALVLRLRAVAELASEQPQGALADVRLMFHLADSTRGEPLVWSLKARLVIVEHAIQPIWEGLARRQWSEDQLLALERELAGFDAVRDYSVVLRSELAWHLKMIDHLRDERMANSINCMCGDPIFWPTLAYRLAPNGWFDLNKAALARCYQAALPNSPELSQRILSPSIARRFEEVAGQVRRGSWSPGNLLAAMGLSSLERETIACARAQTFVDLARLACALERFRRANGSLPESLDSLTPTFVRNIPRDVINGESLHYRRTDTGAFLLFSVGWNEKDDGGEPDPRRFTTLSKPTGDWVWRYPQE